MNFLTLLFALGCTSDPAPVTTPEVQPPPPAVEDDAPFNVLILVFDGCRADRTGAYGYDRPTTPNLDALAADPDSVLYERYYVEGNWTKPSTATLFTGLYLNQHGVYKPHDKSAEAKKWSTQVLADGHVTLAESLGAIGFETFGVVKSWHLVPEYGFAQGFDTYIGPENKKRKAAVNQLVKEADNPFFGYAHLSGCHIPFQEKKRHWDIMDRFAPDYDEEARKSEGVDFATADIRHAIRKGELTLEPEDEAYLSMLYDAKYRWVDENEVARLLAGLRQSGQWDRTLLIVTADHGEELYEHKGYGHSETLWDEVINVPLIVKFPAGHRPSQLPKRVSMPVTNVDLYPSILEFLGQPIPEELPGRPILQSPTPGFAFSQFIHPDDTVDWVVIEGGQKLYVKQGETMLFDQAADPGEQNNLAVARPEEVGDRFKFGQSVFALGAREQGEARDIETTLSDDALSELKALGYIE